MRSFLDTVSRQKLEPTEPDPGTVTSVGQVDMGPGEKERTAKRMMDAIRSSDLKAFTEALDLFISLAQ